MGWSFKGDSTSQSLLHHDFSMFKSYPLVWPQWKPQLPLKVSQDIPALRNFSSSACRQPPIPQGHLLRDTAAWAGGPGDCIAFPHQPFLTSLSSLTSNSCSLLQLSSDPEAIIHQLLEEALARTCPDSHFLFTHKLLSMGDRL